MRIYSSALVQTFLLSRRSGAVSYTAFPNWALSSSFKEATWLAMIPLILTLYILPTDFTEDHPGHLPPWQYDGTGPAGFGSHNLCWEEPDQHCPEKEVEAHGQIQIASKKAQYSALVFWSHSILREY